MPTAPGTMTPRRGCSAVSALWHHLEVWKSKLNDVLLQRIDGFLQGSFAGSIVVHPLQNWRKST